MKNYTMTGPELMFEKPPKPKLRIIYHALKPSMASKEFPLQPNCSLPVLRLGTISGQNRK